MALSMITNGKGTKAFNEWLQNDQNIVICPALKVYYDAKLQTLASSIS